MARPLKEGLEGCPSFLIQVRPQRKTMQNLNSSDFKTRYNALRNIASAYIKNPKVRSFFISSDSICEDCGSQEGLSIDHIVDVYTFAKNDLDYKCLNCMKNLRVICSICNSKKKTIGYLSSKYDLLCNTQLETE